MAPAQAVKAAVAPGLSTRRRRAGVEEVLHRGLAAVHRVVEPAVPMPVGLPGRARHAQGQRRTARVGLQDEIGPDARDVGAHGRVLALARPRLAIGQQGPDLELGRLRSLQRVDEHHRRLVVKAGDGTGHAAARDLPGQGGEGIEHERVRALEPARMQGVAVVVRAQLVAQRRRR